MRAKQGCSAGECGVYTVMLDGRLANSCLVLAGQADGRQVETIEWLAKNGKPHPLRKAFAKNGAVQLGFCTPEMIIIAKALLERDNNPDG